MISALVELGLVLLLIIWDESIIHGIAIDFIRTLVIELSSLNGSSIDCAVIMYVVDNEEFL